MAGTATLHIRLTVQGADGQGVILNEDRITRWSPSVVKRESVSLTGSSTFTALLPPSGSKAVLIIPPAGATSWILKGITGDTGSTMIPATTPILGPTFLTLGASPSIGILNDGATAVAEVIWT